MDAALKTALEQPVIVPFTAVRLVLADGELRLTSAPDVVIDGRSYTGEDATHGSLNEFERVTEGSLGSSTRWAFSVASPTLESMSVLASPSQQGRLVEGYLGALDTATGAVVGTEILFRGVLDQTSVSITESGRVVRFECGSLTSLQLRREGHQRLSNSFHTSCFPGETALHMVAFVHDWPVFWRLEGRRPAIQFPGITVAPGSVGTGGGGGGWGGTGGGLGTLTPTVRQ